MHRWKDKVAVVTGASSGIGAAVARRLVESGMIVVGIARRFDKLQELQNQLTTPDRFHPYKCDVGVEQDIIELFRTVDQKLGRIDVLINNAAIARFTSLLDPSAEALEALFNINCIGPCLCTREALRLMKKHNIDSGYILFTNSIGGHRLTPFPNPDGSGGLLPIYPYRATKHALKAIVEGLRQELRAEGSRIRVGEVSPGTVDTEIARSFFAPNSRENSASRKTEVQEYFKKDSASTSSSGGGGALKIEPMKPDDIADAFIYMLSAPERADVNEIIVTHIA